MQQLRDPTAPVLAGRGPDPRVTDRFDIDVEDVRIGLIHDLDNTQYVEDEEVTGLLLRRFSTRVDIAVSGHTHIPTVWGLADGTALLDPGTTRLRLSGPSNHPYPKGSRPVGGR